MKMKSQGDGVTMDEALAAYKEVVLGLKWTRCGA